MQRIPFIITLFVVVNLMLNRSAIFAFAWASYRLARPAIFAAGDDTGKRCFVRSLFARMLTQAWAEAKAARAQALREELALVDYAPLGVRTSERRRDLSAQLDALSAGVR